MASGNTQVELGDFLERHKVKVASDSEIEAHLNFWTPNIQNFATVRKDRHQGQGGRLPHIDSQIYKLLSEARFTRYSGKSSSGRVDYK